MTQYDFGSIDTAETSGAELANIVESFRTAVISSHKGASRPSYAVNGTMWVDDSSGDWVLNLYNESLDVDVPIGTYDVETGTFLATGSGGGAGIDQVGLAAGRSSFDDEAQGFLYFETDTNTAYLKNSATSADWSDGFSIQGPAGEDADLGALLVAAVPVTVTSDGGLELNVAGGDNLSFEITLDQNTTVAFPSNVPNSGVTIDLHVIQDETGGWTLSFPGASGFNATGGNNPTPALGADEETLYVIKVFSTSPASALVSRVSQKWKKIT